MARRSKVGSVRNVIPAGSSRISVADVVVRNHPGILTPAGEVTSAKGPEALFLPKPHIPKADTDVIRTSHGAEMPAVVAHTQMNGGITPEELWDLAKVNANYYLDKALKDDCRKYWFQYPKHRYQYSEHVLIDPSMASELFKFSAPNRNPTDDTVEMYARDISNARWIRTNESIGIDEQLRFFDGWQRAEAIIVANKPWPMYVTWNCDAAAIMAVDSGRPRNTRQKMKLIMPSLNLSGRLSAVCRSAMRGTSTTHIKYSVQDLGEFALKYKTALEWIEQNFDGRARADVTAAVLKGYLWFGSHRLEKFCTEYSNAVFGEGSPARALHLFMSGGRAKNESPLVIYRKACNAVSKAACNESCDKLYESDDIFEWEGNWEIPENAPSKKLAK